MDQITAALLSWYDRCARVLPWRGFHDAYRTWVSESMLQQTRVETVLSYYPRFLERFPTLSALAESDEADVLKAWEGLGYYSRARNLWKGAKQVMEQYGGVLPREPEKLRNICGIGPYSAGAIASIAYDIPVPAVDGNVIRVISRLYGIRSDALENKTRHHIEALASALVPAERPGDHNQAVMDLGATVCIPGTPNCHLCPLSAFCDAFRTGDAADLPVLPKSKPPKVVIWNVILIRSSGRVLMRMRSERLLQGLWCFPMIEEESSPEALREQIIKKFHLSVGTLSDAGPARHVFTHQIWQMHIYETDAEDLASAPDGYEFIPVGHLKDLPLPVAMNAAVAVLTHSA